MVATRIPWTAPSVAVPRDSEGRSVMKQRKATAVGVGQGVER